MLPYRCQVEAKCKRDDVGSSRPMVLGYLCDGGSGGESPPPLPHDTMEEEVFDDIVRDLFPCGLKGGDDSLEKNHLFFIVETSIFEGYFPTLLILKELLSGFTLKKTLSPI